MKKLILLLFVFSVLSARSQYYQFTKSTGTYANITGGTVLINTNWTNFSRLFKTPFPFKYFTSNIFDSIELTDWGSIFFNNINNGYFDAFRVPLTARGNAMSPVSYATTGSSPNRILQIEYQNAGFSANVGLTDYMNFQVWIYETTNMIEFRYGPNSVNVASYGGDTGPIVVVGDPIAPSSNYIYLEGNPANPTLNTTNGTSSVAMTGTPANGTIYRFTPSPYKTGIVQEKSVTVNLISNRIELPADLKILQISIINANGQTIAQADNAKGISLESVPHGIYLVSIKTENGLLNRKLVW